MVSGAAVGFNNPPLPFPLPVGIGFTAPDTYNFGIVGQYLVSYTFAAATANTTLALLLNGVEVPGSRFTSLLANVPVTGQALVVVGAVPATLTLVNVGVGSAVSQPGVQMGTVSASLTVVKLI